MTLAHMLGFHSRRQMLDTLSVTDYEEWVMYYEITGRQPDAVERTLARFCASVHGLMNGRKSTFKEEYVWPYLNVKFHSYLTEDQRTPQQQHDLVAKTMTMLGGMC